MIGIGVVTLVTVLVASLDASFGHGITTSLASDLVIDSGGSQSGGVSPRLVTVVAGLPQVRKATGLGAGTMLIDGASTNVSIADPRQLAPMLRLGATSGTLSGLGPSQLAVFKATAAAKGWRVGTPVTVQYADGATQRFTIGTLYQADAIVGDYLLSRAAWAAHEAQSRDTLVLITLKDGVSLSAGAAAVTRAAWPFGAPTVQTRQDYITAQTASTNQLLDLAYVLLALAIIIALLGIGNTLALSLYERTRELGLLRAVGATRRQVCALVRWESVIIALWGTVGGVALGLFTGWAVAKAITAGGAGAGTALVTPLIITVLGALAGVLAAIHPARRAARLDVLEAIATG